MSEGPRCHERGQIGLEWVGAEPDEAGIWMSPRGLPDILPGWAFGESRGRDPPMPKSDSSPKYDV